MSMNAIASSEVRRNSWCSAPLDSGRIVYAGPSTKAEFDLLPLQEQVHDWKESRVTTILKNDGQTWERRCHSKVVGNFGADEVTVIFQWFDERVVGRES